MGSRCFNQWNLEAIQAGGSMTWDGSVYTVNGETVLRTWAYDLLKGLDGYLAQYEKHGTPNWARAYTILPDATIGHPYSHTLTEGVDLWDPEDDKYSLNLIDFGISRGTAYILKINSLSINKHHKFILK